MNLELFKEIIATYRRNGWELQRALLRPETRLVLEPDRKELFADAELREDEIDALWFARPSSAEREAWELRIVSEQPYSLFEAFAPDESDEDREEKRRQMEVKLREYAAK